MTTPHTPLRIDLLCTINLGILLCDALPFAGTRILRVPQSAIMHKSQASAILFCLKYTFSLVCRIHRNTFLIHDAQLHRSRLSHALDTFKALGSLDQSILTIFLAFEMFDAEHSSWLPLICNFQSTYSGFPITWSYDKLKSTSVEKGFNSSLLDSVDEHVALYSELLCRDVAIINFQFQIGIPAKFIIWASFAITSRGFGGGATGGSTALVPVADLLNHDRNAHVEVKQEISYDYEGQSADEGVVEFYEMVTRRDILAGEEVFNSYGKFCARLWLVGYGFDPQEPEMECADLFLS